MGLFTVRKPRGFHHNYIYYDPRKEKLKEIEKMEKEEKIETPKEFSPEDIRGKFVGATKHLKRRKESGRKPLSYGVLILLIVILLFVMHYLATGSIF